MEWQARSIYWGVLGLAIALGSSNALPQRAGGLFSEQSMVVGAKPANLPKACLPDGIRLTDVVSAAIVPGTANVQTITVTEKLRQLKATCRQQKLVDAAGKTIRFYRLQGCWGNPPVNYAEIMRQQAEAIRRLRTSFTVIEMTCNPTGIPYP